jgi:ribosomal subunit interface protein
MELVLTARGTRITQAFRQVMEAKLARLERIEPRLARLEIEVTSEKNPRQGGTHRVHAVAATARERYRAHADAREAERALDVVTQRLERQIRDHHDRRRARLIAGATRVKSTQAAPTPTDEREAEDSE